MRTQPHSILKRLLAAALILLTLFASPAAQASAQPSTQGLGDFLIFYSKVLLPLLQQLKILAVEPSATGQIKVGVSAGHGGNTGASYPTGKNYEDPLNLEVAFAVDSELKARGYATLMWRTDNKEDSKTEKMAAYQPWGAQELLEFHHNIGGGTGLEVWYQDGNSEGKRLAEILAKKLSAAVGLTNRGAKPDSKSWLGSYYICQSFPLGFLVECGFLDNAEDLKKLAAPGAREKLAKALGDALDEYFGEQSPIIVTEPFAQYSATVNSENGLNIRGGAGTGYSITATLAYGAQVTIVQESAGTGSIKGWGKLSDGRGWVSLDYLTKK